MWGEDKESSFFFLNKLLQVILIQMDDIAHLEKLRPK